MLAPNYWAEARINANINNENVTVMRFGWSNVSEQEAKLHAEERLSDAVIRLEQGEPLRYFEYTTEYNGADGMPIREEVVLRKEQLVITRNPQGILCLNTPHVLFADIDLDKAGVRPFSKEILLAGGLVAALTGLFWSWVAGVWLAMVTVLAATGLGKQAERALGRDPLAGALTRTLNNMVKQDPGALFRLYRTPAGFRVMALHRLYTPGDEDTTALLRALNSDSFYVQMCKNQRCFRARLGPKPWRIGMERIDPALGVWPLKGEALARRQAWINDYNAAAAGFAACELVGNFGRGQPLSQTEAVRELHDHYCGIGTEKPIA